MSDRPPPTRGSRIFAKVATATLLGGGLLLAALLIIRVAVYLIQGF